jgi:hypothetical protein
MRLRKGDRVRIRKGHGWPEGATGVVASTLSTTFGGGPLEALRRRWRTIRGREPVVIRFDEPQADADDDGTYQVAAVDPTALAPLR